MLADVSSGEDDPWLLKRVLYRDRSEEQQLGWAVIQAFAMEVETAGSAFVVVHLPTPSDLELRRGLGRWPYQTFLDALDQQYAVVHPEGRLMALAVRSGLGAVDRGHLTPVGNRIVAEELQPAVLRAAGR